VETEPATRETHRRHARLPACIWGAGSLSESHGEDYPPAEENRQDVCATLPPCLKSAGDKDRFEDLDSVTRCGGDSLLGTKCQ
jgi:hypothetical protein